MEKEGGPNRPKADPVRLDAKAAAVVVLDLSARCESAVRGTGPQAVAVPGGHALVA